SAVTAMVIIDSESTSRSSVKVFSAVTSAVSMPVSSETISARPARISWSLCAMSVLLVCRVLRRVGLVRGPVGPTGGLGEGHDLPGPDEAGAEADLQGEPAGLDLALAQHPVHREGDGRGRGVGGGADVARDGQVR